jgi:ABC-type polysaccharide/polyol phosphate export permease
MIDDFIELEPDKFYSNMIQHISSAFDENESIIKQKENDLKWLIALTLLETSTIVCLTLLFFSFGLF